jgi:hypothetical protein
MSQHYYHAVDSIDVGCFYRSAGGLQLKLVDQYWFWAANDWVQACEWGNEWWCLRRYGSITRLEAKNRKARFSPKCQQPLNQSFLFSTSLCLDLEAIDRSCSDRLSEHQDSDDIETVCLLVHRSNRSTHNGHDGIMTCNICFSRKLVLNRGIKESYLREMGSLSQQKGNRKRGTIPCRAEDSNPWFSRRVFIIGQRRRKKKRERERERSERSEKSRRRMIADRGEQAYAMSLYNVIMCFISKLKISKTPSLGRGNQAKIV